MQFNFALFLALGSASAFSPAVLRSTVSRRSVVNFGEAHGGELIDLFEGVDKDAEIASCTKEIQLNARQLCDTELICNGGFSPLTGFMDDESLVVGDKVLLKQGDLPIATLTVESKYLAN